MDAPTDGEIFEGVVTKLANFLSQELDSFLIRNLDDRKEIVRKMLRTGKLTQMLPERFELSKIMGLVSDDVPVSVMPTVTVNALLTNSERAKLVANNPDYVIVFNDVNPQPHALAYAQRIIDTHRCKASVSYRGGRIIDIGGNYATHAMSGASGIHSCTLKEGHEEYHRQTQRDVQLMQDDCNAPDFCTVGVQNCDIMARQGICIHALPMINPDHVVPIFKQHGFHYVTGVHHYDVAMDSSQFGFMEDVDMHWRMTDGGTQIEHFFEGDSSYAYKHRTDWMHLYSTSQLFINDEIDPAYGVAYTVDKIANGILRWTMREVNVDTLGPQRRLPVYRTAPENSKVIVMLPQYVEGSGRSIDDPKAYETAPLEIPKAMFEYVYRSGMANDTQRPDNPLSYHDIKQKVFAYGAVRRINGVPMTVDNRLQSKAHDLVAHAIYLVVVYKQTMENVNLAAYTAAMKRIQQRMAGSSMTSVLKAVFGIMATPFALMLEPVLDVHDYILVYMRQVLMKDGVVAKAMESAPFRVIGDVYSVDLPKATKIVDPHEHIAFIDTPEPSEKPDEDSLSIFADEMSSISDEPTVPRDSDTQAGLFADFDFEFNREGWNNAADKYQGVSLRESDPIPELNTEERMSTVGAKMFVGTDNQVYEHYNHKILESSLYNLDIALGVDAKAKHTAQDIWVSGDFNYQKIRSLNATSDSAIAVYDVSNFRVVDLDVKNTYAMCYDPVAMTMKELITKSGEVMCPDVENGKIFVMEMMKIYNNRRMAKNLLEYAKLNNPPPSAKWHLVDGIPGCAKTYEIVQSFKPGDMVVSSMKLVSQKTYAQLQTRFPDLESSRVRTCDSAVIHPCPKADTLWIDEALVQFPGTVYYVVAKVRANDVKLFGDHKQLAGVDRGSRFDLLKFRTFKFFHYISERDVTFRSPADALLLIRMFYPESRAARMFTCSNVKRSFSYVNQPDVNAPVYKSAVRGINYMTLLRDDRAKLLKGTDFVDCKTCTGDRSNAGVVSTIHESQGETYEHATVVRMNAFTAEIFNSKPHQLVAVSRHTHTVTYVSAATPANDPLATLFTRAMAFTDEELESVMIETPEWLRDKLDKAKPRPGQV